jgi:spectinomycin phosphotransferase/16S rRNA (guanine(1405)-N(7))-methyltransferase
VGFGSHHWQATTEAGAAWFVTVDEPDSFDELGAALGAAQDLYAGGLSFVVAPVSTRDGAPLARLGRFAVALYPYVEGRSFDWDGWDSPGHGRARHRRAVLDLLVALHTSRIATRARLDDLGIAHRDALVTDRLDDVGPYSRRTARVLRRHRPAIRARLAEYDGMLATHLDTVPSIAVITHGEPHPGNTMRTADGWRLIDWDTVRLAPPERDLWSLVERDTRTDGLAEYEAATGYRPDPALLALFRRRWDLTDLAVTADRFRKPHTGDADDEKSWEILQSLLES